MSRRTPPLKAAPKDTPKRAVLYLRVADATPTTDYGLEQQRAACRHMADRLHATILGEYADVGVAGTTLQRPGLQQLLDAAIEQQPDYVICADMARLARHHQLAMEVAIQLLPSGTRIALAHPDAVMDIVLGDSPSGTATERKTP